MPPGSNVLVCGEQRLSLGLEMEMERRDFLIALGGTAAWVVAAQAQQPGPTVGFLHPAPGGALIDRGVDVGYPFRGVAPDLGAFER